MFRGLERRESKAKQTRCGGCEGVRVSRIAMRKSENTKENNEQHNTTFD